MASVSSTTGLVLESFALVLKGQYVSINFVPIWSSYNALQVVNRTSEQIIEELHFDLTSESSSKGILGLCSDASAGLFYAYDQNSIFQVWSTETYFFAWSSIYSSYNN